MIVKFPQLIYHFPMSMTNRELQAENTRRKLRHLAMDMIRRKGYARVTISEICKKAKVAKGTFYLYFSSKKDILFEILASINREMFSRRTWEDQPDPVSKLREFCLCYVRIVTDQGYEFSREIIKIIIEESPDPQLVESDQHWNTIHSILSEGQEKGIFKKSDPDSIADILQGFLFGAIQKWCSRKGDFSIEEYVMNRLDIIIEILALTK